MSTPVAYLCTLDIEASGALHIGSGQGGALVHRLVRRNASGRPYIPGSALKGALRISASRVLSIVNEDLLRRWVNGEPMDARCEPPRPEHMCEGEKVCPVCALFGNVFRPHTMFVADAHARMPVREEALYRHLPEAIRPYGRALDEQTEVYTRVQIDRRRRGAREKALFTTEYVPPRKERLFQTTIQGVFHRRDIQEEEDILSELSHPYLALLVAAIRFTDQIGGEASTGKGWVRMHIRELRVDGQVLEPGDLLDPEKFEYLSILEL